MIYYLRAQKTNLIFEMKSTEISSVFIKIIFNCFFENLEISFMYCLKLNCCSKKLCNL